MGRKVVIELPYEDDVPMHLVDVRAGEPRRLSIVEQIKWLDETNYGDSSELPDIFACAVALFQLGAGRFEDCFMQATVWARG